MPKQTPCQYADGTAHSADKISVYHGTAVPAILCGKHAQGPIDWTKVVKP